MRLAGQRVLVTGGGTGIGRATSLAFAREGASVAINYSRSEEDALKTTAEARAYGVPAITVKADVSRDSEVREMVNMVAREFGGLDILVNNAGVTRFIDYEDLEGLTEDIWDELLAVNLKGTFFCCRAAVPVMKKQGKGAIINIASVAGIIGQGSSIAYCAAKAGVISLTKSLARALAPEIRVNAVAPGFIDTRWHAGREGTYRGAAEAALLKRVGTPEDIAEAVVALAADFSFMTGQTIVVDGGRVI